jgi:NADH-quinone oxidoreductase subunit H
MTIIGVLGFFGKVVAICFIQFFIRWTLPRFRYDQLMKLGWRVLLPLALANVLVTGVGYLAYAHTSYDVQAGFKVAADVTQAFTAAVITGLIVWALIGFAKPTTRKPWVVGSAAKYASELGGTPMSETMQP